MTKEEVEKYKDEMKKERDSFAQWSWFGLMEKLAQGDVTKFDDVAKKPLILCLNLLSYWRQRDKKIEAINKERERRLNNQN